MSADTATRIIAVIAEFRGAPVDQFSIETSMDELEMDSLDGLNLIFELEEEFDIMIPDDKALTMKTIGEMVDGIDRLLAGEVPEPGEGEEVKEVKADPTSA